MHIFWTKLRKILINSGFRNIAVLTSGIILAQIINFLFQPAMTRLYSPENFGILSLLTSLATIFTPILTFQYQTGIITAKSDKEANIVCALTVYLLIIMVLIISIGIVIFDLINPATFEVAGAWIYTVIPLLFFNGLVKIVDSYNNRFEQYKLMSSIALVRSVTSNILKLILGLCKVGFLGLIISQFVATVFGIRRQGKYIISKQHEILGSTYREIKHVAKKYKVQPLYSMPGLFVTTASFSILPIFIATLYDIEQTGYFYLSMGILGVPLTLISGSVSKVFFRKATLEKEKKGNFHSTFISTALLLIIFSLIGFSILWFVAEPLFSIVFGQKWLRSGTFVKILIPLFAARFVVTGMMNGFIVAGKQLLKLVLQILFIASALIIYFATKNLNLAVESFLGLINNSYLIIYLILFVVLYMTSKNKL